jgi:citrate synthase
MSLRLRYHCSVAPCTVQQQKQHTVIYTQLTVHYHHATARHLQVTTRKKETLILNVDGCIAACFVDMLRSCGAFTQEEADELIANGCLNGLFVLGRSVGFIGHYLDQKRLKQPLYRHPWDDISYIQGDMN